MLNKADKFLSDLVVYTKYANYLESQQRRQSWYEAVDELMNMHIRKFPHLKDQIRKHFLLVYDKKVLPSMRSIQFGGLPIEFAPNRIFNCSYALIDDKYVFTEIMFLLLGGSGIGYSVRKAHVAKLPMVKAPIGTKRFLIGDSIEGWSDSIRHLMVAYFDSKPLPEFDYRDIRKKGAKIKKTGGKAPGPEKLIETHRNMIRLLNKAVGRFLTTVECHDLACYIADCVLAGGVRDAAMISLFDKDDKEMLTSKSMFNAKYISHTEDEKERRVKISCETKHYYDDEFEVVMTKKYGDWDFDHLVNDGKIAWYYVHPQRGRANNSVALNRTTTTRTEFEAIMQACEASYAGEPGVYWCNNDHDGTNPSLRKGTLVLTDSGIIPIDQLEGRAFKVKNLNGVWSPANCFLSGRNKQLTRIKLEDGSEYYATDEHKWPVFTTESINRISGRWKKYYTTELEVGMQLPVLKNTSITSSKHGDKNDGFVIGWLYGDGWISTRKKTGKVQYGMCISRKDANNGVLDKMQGIIAEKFGDGVSIRYREDRELYDICLNSERAREYFARFGVGRKELGIPTGMWTNVSDEFIAGFIDGLISSDGYVYKHKDSSNVRVGFTSVNEKLIDDVKTLLGFYGIISRKKKQNSHKGPMTFPNGKVTELKDIRQPYILDICNAANVSWFASLFTLTHKEKWSKMSKHDRYVTNDKDMIKVVSVEKTELFEDVWDISVYDNTHCFQLASCVTGNCGEIALPPNMFCNLTTAVVYDCQSQAELNQRVRTAAFIGTLQASYTDFHMLRPIWKENTEREALLGVSLTGMASGDVFKLDLEEAANNAVNQNLVTAKEIGINPAYRITCIKPEGSGTLAAGVMGNGAHDIHAEQYIRSNRLKKTEPLYARLLEIMPEFVEDEFQNEEHRAVISIPLKAKPGALTRDKSTAIGFLERIKMLNEKWILPGHIQGENTHNVSATVSIRPEEWADVTNWMWNHKNSYNGISCLPYSEHSYRQAPFQEITLEQYEELFAKFPDNFDFTTVIEEDNNTDLVNELACSSGHCSI